MLYYENYFNCELNIKVISDNYLNENNSNFINEDSDNNDKDLSYDNDNESIINSELNYQINGDNNDDDNFLEVSLLSEFPCQIKNIIQMDGNDSITSSDSEQSNLNIKQIKNFFRIMEVNVNSLKGKKEEFKSVLNQHNPDCVVLVETKLDNTYANSEFFDINQWNIVVREDRNIYGGGIIIAVLRKYIATPIEINYKNGDNPELYWIKLHTVKNVKPVYICGLYRSQKDKRSSNTINCLHESISKLPGRNGQKHLIITGDVNLHIDWDVNEPKFNSFTKQLDEQMLMLCDKFNLTQKVDFPTRGENTLDLFLSSDPSKVISVKSAPPMADHNIVISDVDLCIKKKPQSQHIIYKWNKADIEGMNKFVEIRLSQKPFQIDSDIEDNWNNFKEILLEARDKFVPHRMSTSRHNLPWYTQNLRRLCNKKQRLYNKANKSKSAKDIKAFKLCRSEYKRLLKKARKDYYLDFLDPKLDDNSKFLFNYIKRLKKDSVGIEALNFKGKLTVHPNEKAEALATQYESVFQQEDLSNIPNILPSPYPDMKEIQINEKGVLAQLEKLNVNKSTGPDGLSPHLLKMLAKVISPSLTNIYKQSLQTSKNPLDWRLQFITPILKPGKNKLDPASYRPISITSICCKILEHIIYSETMDHLEKYNILSDFQHGYRNKCSTETQLLKVVDYFAKSLENKTQTDSIFLDFSRAFDVVPHKRLLLKMNYYGFRKYLPWIQNFLSERKQSVVVDGVKSRFVSVTSGLPQGTVLAALLFLVFINDLPESITKSFTGLFCDDTLLAKEILTEKDTEELQNDLNNVL